MYSLKKSVRAAEVNVKDTGQVGSLVPDKAPLNDGVRLMGDSIAASSVKSQVAIRNVNFFLAADDHRMLRKHAIETDRSLQSIMAEAMNLYLAQHHLGPIKLVKAYRT